MKKYPQRPLLERMVGGLTWAKYNFFSSHILVCNLDINVGSKLVGLNLEELLVEGGIHQYIETRGKPRMGFFLQR